MAYVDELSKQITYRPTGFDLGLNRDQAYASYFPQWEVQTPQYIQPNAYTTAQVGFRANDFLYSLITKRAKAESKGRFVVYDNRGKHPVEVKDHSLALLIRKPNKNITENMFWQMKRISQDIAGFSAWEIEYNNAGKPIRLWFMRPDWCSFIRGQGDPLKYIRYQPYGLPPMDIPLIDDNGRTKVLFFSNGEDFDPLFPGVRFYSPSMHALPQIKIDNGMTNFLADFVSRGAKFSGLISLAQTVDDTIASDIKRRWQESYGGSDNWSNVGVMGLGATYQQMQMNFKDMAFGELDARAESRMCNVFEMEQIVADARAGLDVSSYNNKKEAVKDWYYGWVSDTWADNGETMTNQMLPIYGDASGFVCGFDTSKVHAMQEDRTGRWTRAVSAWTSKLITRNAALEEAGAQPVEGAVGEEYYTAQAQPVTAEKPEPAEKPEETTPEKEAAKTLERKNFRRFAANRRAEGKLRLLQEYEFKFLTLDERRELLAEFGAILPDDAGRVVGALAAAVRAELAIVESVA